ncbi:MAG: hypothetical protein WBY88_12795 [Desulfosarcina sp.]
MTSKLVNPVTGEVADEFETMDDEEVQERIDAAERTIVDNQLIVG